MQYTMVASCLFGLESIINFELKRLGAYNIQNRNGRVYFDGDENILARANIALRTAERVMVVLGETTTTTFEQVYEFVKSLNLTDFIDKDSKIIVKGHSIDSMLKSVPSLQSIIKKAVCDNLCSNYNLSYLSEKGNVIKLNFLILKDKLSLCMDTSGEPLYKRGYRADGGEAPIRETLAAALCDLAFVNDKTFLVDPFCGSGTILIEAAMRAKNIAPGLNRNFAFENIAKYKEIFKQEKRKLTQQIKKNTSFFAHGFDIDKTQLTLAKNNIKKANVDSCIKLKELDVGKLNLKNKGYNCLITNPPYGERLLDVKKSNELLKILAKAVKSEPSLNHYIITPSKEIEVYFSKAKKRRKLSNGDIECTFYQYFS